MRPLSFCFFILVSRSLQFYAFVVFSGLFISYPLFTSNTLLEITKLDDPVNTAITA